jgi:predicted ATPase
MPITELRIEGLRTIEKLRLKLDGLTVLIGDNGTGKSSIIEACELLRRATGERFVDEFYSIHGGFSALLRQGARALRLGVTIHPAPEELSNAGHERIPDLDSIDYELALIPGGAFAMLEETVVYRQQRGSSAAKSKSRAPAFETHPAIRRLKDTVEIHESGPRPSAELFEIAPQATFLSQFHLQAMWNYADSAVDLVIRCLKGFRVHLPFEVMPAWAARALDRKSALRTSAPFAPAEHLEKLGINLANSYHALKNNFGQAQWKRTLEYVRLGLGDHIEDVTTWPEQGGGNIGLSLKFKNLDQQIPSSQLSDGMLTYLAFVALFRLHGTRTTLMALDEPDLHLHPRLLMRVLDMFESMARETPVLIATHSDRLLDGLSDPARSAVLCELDETRATRLLRPDPRALKKWLERYRGLGDIRGAGHEASVLTREEPA